MDGDEKIAVGWQSEDEEVTLGFRTMDPDRHHLQSRSGNGTSSTASVGHASDSSRKKKSSQCRCCPCCSCLLMTRILDLLLLLVVAIVQGSLLNYLLVWHRQESHTVYLWFLVDFLVVISFVGALTSSYMHIARRLRTALTAATSLGKSRTMQGQKPLPVYGTLPLSYISWLVYSAALAARIIFVFRTDVIKDMGNEGLFTPQRFKIALCVSSIVFLLLVHAHGVVVRSHAGHSGSSSVKTDAAAAADRRRFISSLCATTAFEVFDAVAFLELLFPTESGVMLTYPLEAVILTLVTVHLLLPAASLYQLSLCDFGSRGHRPSARIGLFYSLVKLAVIEVPYLGIRAYLWDVYGASTSVIFLMKNVLMIFVKVRYLIPEYIAVMVDEKRVDAADSRKELQLKALT